MNNQQRRARQRQHLEQREELAELERLHQESPEPESVAADPVPVPVTQAEHLNHLRSAPADESLMHEFWEGISARTVYLKTPDAEEPVNPNGKFSDRDLANYYAWESGAAMADAINSSELSEKAGSNEAE